jgi:hypothetical protein
VVALGESGAEVALTKGRLIAKRLRFGDSPKKVSPADLASAGTLVLGDRVERGGAS